MLDSHSSGHDSIDPVFADESIRHGILRKYDISDPNIPIQALRKVLRKKADRIHGISLKAMEKPVASILSDHSPGCTVSLCGRSGDGGIDLLLVEADKIIAVQVKLRLHPTAVEPVNLVREFLGGSLVEGIDNLIYVTTADHFTGGRAGAIELAKKAVDRRIVSTFELIDRERFLGMLNLLSPAEDEPWKKFLPSVFASGEFWSPY